MIKMKLFGIIAAAVLILRHIVVNSNFTEAGPANVIYRIKNSNFRFPGQILSEIMNVDSKENPYLCIINFLMV